MATPKQKRFVSNLLANNIKQQPETLKALALRSGFSKTMAKQPSRILKSKGVKEIFAKAGISADKIATQWNKIIALEPTDRFTWNNKITALKELDRLIIEPESNKISAAVQFIDKFLYVDKLGLNRGKIGSERQINKEVEATE